MPASSPGSAGSVSAGSNASDANLADQITGSSINPDQASVPDEAPGVPDGVEITQVDDVDGENGHVKRLHIQSQAMPDGEFMWDGDLAGEQRGEMLVELILPRDWYTDPDATFPSLYGLNGLYGSEYSSAWLEENRGDGAEFFKDKNIMAVLPVGGGGSFYTDWQQSDGGKNFQWETFLTKELPPILEQGWRTNERRAVNGLSMGATGATILAGRNAEMFDFVASFSGYLDTTSPGMPYAFGQIAG